MTKEKINSDAIFKMSAEGAIRLAEKISQQNRDKLTSRPVANYKPIDPSIIAPFLEGPDKYNSSEASKLQEEYLKLGVDLDNEQSKPYYKGQSSKFLGIARKMTALKKKIDKVERDFFKSQSKA